MTTTPNARVIHARALTIHRPEARNAVNTAVAQGIEAAIDRLESDPSVWVGVLTGVPPVFSGGADLKDINAGRREMLRTERGGFAGFVARNRIKPVIAAVDGRPWRAGWRCASPVISLWHRTMRASASPK